jgi:hypothetical protein
MGLIKSSGPDWAYCTHNFPATVDLSSIGAAVTAGASNADGTAVSLFSSALTHDVEYLRIAISGPGTSAVDSECLVTILIDPAGGTSWSPLISYLAAGFLISFNSSNQRPWGAEYDFPLWVPAGASLGVRARTANGSTLSLRVQATAYGGNANPASWWCGQRVSTIGAVAASSRGTLITPGASASFGSWTDMGSPLDGDCGSVQFGCTGTVGVVASSYNHLIELGVGGVRIGAPIWRFVHSSDIGFQLSNGPCFRRLPSGTQLQTRAACDAASPLDIGMIAYAVH